MRTRSLLCTLMALLCCYPGVGAAKSEIKKPRSIADYLPGETMIFSRIDRSLINPELYSRTALGQVSESDEVKSFKASKRWGWSHGTGSKESIPKFSINDVLNLFSKEVAFSLIEAGQSSKPPKFVAAVTAQIGDRGREIDRFLSAVRGKITSAITGVTWNTDEKDPAVTHIIYKGLILSYAREGGYFILGVGDESLNRIRHALKRPAKKPLSALLSNIDERSPFISYVNPRELILSLSGDKTGNQNPLLQMIMQNLPNSIASSAQIEPPGVKSVTFLASSTATVSRSDERILADDALRIVPEQAPSCLAVIFDAEALYKKNGQIINPNPMPTPGQMPSPLDMALSKISTRLGIDVKNEFLPVLKGDLVIFQTATPGVFFPDFVVSLPVENMHMADKFLAAVQKSSLFELSETRYMDFSIKSLTSRLGGSGNRGGVNLSLYYVLADNRILLSNNAPALKDELYYLRSGKPSIIKSSDFQAVTTHLPARRQFLSYHKPSGNSLESLYAIATMVANIGCAAKFKIIDPVELPRASLFSKETFGSATAGSRLDNGFLFESFSPEGLGACPALKNGESAAVAGLLAAIAIPNFIRARTTTQKNICINNMRQFDAAKEQYSLKSRLKTGDRIDPVSSLNQYLTNLTVTSKCPSGGTYQNIDKIGSATCCSVHGSVEEATSRRRPKSESKNQPAKTDRIARRSERLQKMLCHNNIRQFKAAKAQYALESGLNTGDKINPVSTLNQYLSDLTVSSKCPSDGTYTNLDVVGSPVSCSIHGDFSKQYSSHE
jgi:hypothetical protein